MANAEQLERLTRSVTEWNQWQREHPRIDPDLSSVSLSGTDLQGANLQGADLASTNLSEANLQGANLQGACLNGANLSRANLSRANLYGANLHKAYLIEARLNNSDLANADLSHANLNRANLTDANLTDADLIWTDLTDTDLTDADLNEADFTRASLSNTNLTEACFGYTIFAWLDLSHAKGLETAIHRVPSIVDINSVVLPSDGNARIHFLRGVGFSDIAIEYLPSILIPAAIQYYSLFISYAHQDEALARRLYKDLQNNGVRCWMAPHDLRPGDYHHSRIDEAIHLHEKVLLLLSEHAINSSWIKHEVQIALVREVKQDCTILFPLRLDQMVMQTDKDWAVRLRESRHIGNSTGWQDDTAYQQAFATLLRHLKVTKPPTV